MKVALQGRAQGAQQSLYEEAGIEIKEGRCRSEDELIELIGDADGAQVGIMPLTSRYVMESCPRLKVVSRFGVGVDSIDIDAATELGVMVCNVPGSNTTEVADHAVSLLLSVTRRLYDAISSTRKGDWADNPRAMGTYTPTMRRLSGHTMGIVGFGNIGRAFATRIRGFGVSRILAHDPYVNQLAGDLYGVSLVDFDTLLAESDFITIHCSATSETNNLFNAEAFQRMKSTALLVNTARGPIVDEEALADALEKGEIEAAAVDVTRVEPLPTSSRLLSLPNCYVTPHVAAMSEVFVRETAIMQAENIIRVLTGEKPHGLANPEAIKTVAVMRHTEPGRWAGFPDFSTALQV
ncbi:MAG: C-terminal binding protein [Gammaproteobacteria bacterium]|nr:C-terminal binding protein [Gammaproteobacteria bacterium]